MNSSSLQKTLHLQSETEQGIYVLLQLSTNELHETAT